MGFEGMPNPSASTPDDARLIAYLDGELDAEARAEIDKRLASNPALAARLEFLSLGGGAPLLRAFDDLTRTAPIGRLKSFLDALPSGATGSSALRKGQGLAPQLVAAVML